MSNEALPLQSCSTPESRVLADTNDLFKIAMDIPGVNPKDLDVSVDSDSRTVNLVGNRRDDQGELAGCFQTSWQLDESVDLESLVMQHDNGVLTVWSPKEVDRESTVSKRRELMKQSKKQKAFVRRRGSATKTRSTNTSKPTLPQATVTKLKPVITKRIERYEDPIMPEEEEEEDPMHVEAIAYDEQELLESVSVLTDEEGEYWFHRM